MTADTRKAAGAYFKYDALSNGIEPAEITMEEYLVSLRGEMGYYDAPIMEKLLIENIVTCWLRLQNYEQQLAFRNSNTATIEFLGKRVSVAT
jgi:hypothetical protein